MLLKYVGLNPIVVHGGGPEITGYMERLGLPVEFVGGLRVSSEDTVEVAKMVLVGKVNKEIVLRLQRHGQPAVGLCGDDGSLFRVARRTAPGGEDIGFVGRIERVNVGVIEHVASDYIPVIASVGADRDGSSYNVNADEAAGAVAGALGAYKVVFLTDVPGWLGDAADPGSLIKQASCRRGPRRPGRARRRHAPEARSVPAGDRRGRLRRAHPRRAHAALAAARAVHRRRHRHEDHRRRRRGGRVTLAELQRLESESMIGSYARLPVEFVRGEGPLLWDDEGNEYLDFLCGISVTSIGHCHPAVVAAVREQAGRLMHVSNLFYTEPAMRLAERLSAREPRREGVPLQLGRRGQRGGDQARPQGAPARRDSGRRGGVPRPHLRCALGHSAGGQAGAVRAAGARLPCGRARCRGARGRRSTSAPPRFCSSRSRARRACTRSMRTSLRLRARACDEHGAALIFDEIQTGMGRTGTLWAYEQAGVAPDAMTVAKALGGGMPIGALITGERLADVLAPGDHGSTFAGGPVACAAALAALDVTDDEALMARVRELGTALAERLRELPHVVSVRGTGLMLGCRLDVDAPGVVRRALLEQRLVLNATGADTVRLLPPLTISLEHIEDAAGRLGAVLSGAVAEPAR